QGQLIAKLTSQEAIKDLLVSLSLEGQGFVHAQHPVSFTINPKDYKIKEFNIEPQKPFLTADGKQEYTYKAIIIDENGNILRKKEVANVKWDKNIKDVAGLILTPTNAGTVTTSEAGELIAKLSSKDKVDDVLVSLSIEGHSPVFVDKKQVVSFKPEQMSEIDVSPTTAILVNKAYTLTIKVTDATSEAEPNKQVNWSIKDTSQQGLTFNPKISTTNNSGEATTLLTSSQVNQNVIVVASVDGVGTKETKTPLEFGWPIIHKPTFIPASGNVIADADKHPDHAYHYTAKVYLPDNNAIYTEQDIKFKWRLKPLADGTEPKNTWLSETGDVTVKPDGTLQVQLMSSQLDPVVTDAVVCLAVVDKNSTGIPSTEQCADPVSFAKPAENLKIDSLHVEFDPSQPIMGGSANQYIYTAKIVKSDAPNTELPDGYKVDATWATEQTPNGYNGKPEWIITSDNTVKNGVITAKLSSQVGIGDIKNGQVTDGLMIKLTVPAGEGKTDSKEADHSVAFDTPVKPAGIIVYVKEADGITIKKSKIFEDQNRPSNSFSNMYIKLFDLSIKKDVMAEGGKIIESLGFGDDNNDFNTIDTTTGEIPIGNPAQNSIKTSITIRRVNNAKYAYKYSFWIKNLVRPQIIQGNYPSGIVDQNSNPTCVDPYVTGLRDVNEVDIGISENSKYSLNNEFPHSYDWGLLDSVTPFPPVTSKIIAKYKNTSQGSFTYDIKKDHLIVNENELYGYLLCIVSYFP
ncbi:hypothetical protein, partial [Xenorhabdus littoralis]|uniref:hypothetical protein n=1 Tax=Xenorhabdus littoralis TaxID=2582835 RepID=UPI0029E825F4